MTTADNNGLDPQASGSAPEAPMIPKHRFDEVLERLRNAENMNKTQGELLNQLRPSQPQQVDTFEDSGLEPAVAKAVAMIASKIAKGEVGVAAKQMQGALGMAAQRSDEALFLAQHGSDKAKYLDKIKEQRQYHYQQTGTVLPVEMAYKLVVFDEFQGKTAARPAAVQANHPAPAVAQAAPPAAEGQQNQPAPAAGGAKKLDEMNIEEMESFLNQRMTAEGQVF